MTALPVAFLIYCGKVGLFQVVAMYDAHESQAYSSSEFCMYSMFRASITCGWMLLVSGWDEKYKEINVILVITSPLLVVRVTYNTTHIQTHMQTIIT